MPAPGLELQGMGPVCVRIISTVLGPTFQYKHGREHCSDQYKAHRCVMCRGPCSRNQGRMEKHSAEVSWNTAQKDPRSGPERPVHLAGVTGMEARRWEPRRSCRPTPDLTLTPLGTKHSTARQGGSTKGCSSAPIPPTPRRPPSQASPGQTHTLTRPEPQPVSPQTQP